MLCITSFPSKSPTAADQSSWAALKHSRFQNYFTLEFFSTFQKVQLQQIRAADTFRFFNFGWDDLIDGWKEGRMDGRMVPRRIMVFVFRLCLLGIILPSVWRENLTLRIFSIFFQLVMRWLGRWLQRWKDGTKTDNGICRNLVTLKMVTPKLLGTRLHRTQPFCGVQHF